MNTYPHYYLQRASDRIANAVICPACDGLGYLQGIFKPSIGKSASRTSRVCVNCVGRGHVYRYVTRGGKEIINGRDGGLDQREW